MNKRKIIINTLIIILAVLIIVVMVSGIIVKTYPVLNYNVSLPKVIIDAGHGGEDGGAIGYGGLIEKDVNLSISLYLKDIFTLNGFEVIMTRQEDLSIYDDGKNTIRKKKVSDMKNRLKIIEDNQNAVFVSVHQNIFAESKYNGAQIFYSPNNPKSKELAEIIQQSFKDLLQPQNERKHKKAGKDLFLLYKAQIPAVIVECGFISNPEEAKKLNSHDYQKKVAAVIFDGTLKFITENK